MNRRSDMRQKIFAVMAAVACAVALAGCNAEDTPPSTGPGIKAARDFTAAVHADRVAASDAGSPGPWPASA